MSAAKSKGRAKASRKPKAESSMSAAPRMIPHRRKATRLVECMEFRCVMCGRWELDLRQDRATCSLACRVAAHRCRAEGESPPFLKGEAI